MDLPHPREKHHSKDTRQVDCLVSTHSPSTSPSSFHSSLHFPFILSPLSAHLSSLPLQQTCADIHFLNRVHNLSDPCEKDYVAIWERQLRALCRQIERLAESLAGAEFKEDKPEGWTQAYNDIYFKLQRMKTRRRNIFRRLRRLEDECDPNDAITSQLTTLGLLNDFHADQIRDKEQQLRDLRENFSFSCDTLPNRPAQGKGRSGSRSSSSSD